ncbi:hypothetical protein BB560_006814 [Smittium megazygosporum]|uniref:histidine--tRNA ligase n=1 Tax=Smittium megazygosporum TaxID=133381 RepID=A0A2T9Y196_9FUNG|nr:hypothetical protein BB560_006814 [Smittium megazygosporum]
MPDNLDEDLLLKKAILEKAESVLRPAGYKQASVGESSDIVSKELYSFDDKNGTSVCLRPEGTAGITRAIITNKLFNKLPQRIYYYGPMFRHERPQKGQMYGVMHPMADVEVVLLGWKFLRSLKLENLKINSLGDRQSLSDYKRALVKYLESKKDKLSEDSVVRLEKNPLRILDSKSPQDIEILNDAPKLSNYLNDISVKRFEFVKSNLKSLDIPIIQNDNLVRGLDYYDHTVFEIKSVSDELGKSQDTVLAGGRYDHLVGQMGGPAHISGMGWAAGCERLCLLIKNETPEVAKCVSLILVPEQETREDDSSSNEFGVSAHVTAYASKIFSTLLDNGVNVHFSQSTTFGTSNSPTLPTLSKQLGSAVSQGSDFAIIIGSKELDENTLILKNLNDKQQSVLDFDSALKTILSHTPQ